MEVPKGLKKETHPAHYSVFPDDFENDSDDTEHEITELVDHDKQSEMFDSSVDLGTAPIERSEFAPPPTPESNGFWKGENVTDIREVRNETPPTQIDEQLDLPGIFDGGEAIKPGSKVVEWRDSRPKEAVNANPEVTKDKSEIDLTATSAERASRPERLNTLADVLAPKTLEFFKGMPEKAKRVASGIYEGIYKIPGVNRIVAKAEIAWNQGWVDMKQSRITNLNEKISDISNESSALLESETALKQSLEIIRSQGLANTAGLEQSLAKIGARKSALGEVKTQYENLVALKMKSANDFIERRNSVTDRMVNSYGEKMKSVEQNLEKLNGLRDAMEFQTAVQEVDLAEQMGRLNTLDAEHKKIEAALRNAGQLDKNGEHPMLIRMADEIKMGKEKIAAAEAKTQMKSFSIYAKIVETKDKVGTYRDKQKEFSLIKERNAPILKNTSESARKETSEAELERSPVAESFTATEHLAESSRLTIGSFLDKWNEHLKESLPDSERSTLNIDKAEFLKGARWGESRELEYEQFLKVVEGYYRKNRIDFKERATIGEKFKESKIDKK